MADESRPLASEATGSDNIESEADVARSGAPIRRVRRVTLRDVGRAAGVSPSTVSRVLGGVRTSVSITEATREHVHRTARELGYRPDPLARGLQGSRTALIGLIVRDLSYPLHAPLMEHVVDAIRAEDHHVVIGTSRELTSESSQLEHIISTRMCDGIVMIGGLDDRAEVVEEIHDARLPTVGIGLAITDERIPVVRGDNATGAQLVFEHLEALGHQRVGIIQTGSHTELRHRAEAFIAAASAAGWEDTVTLVEVQNEPLEAAAALRSLMTHHRPTAIFVTSDHAAYGVLAEAARMGIDVPRDLSVVGYDDLAMSATLFPSLTTVRQDLGQLASRAVSWVFGIIRTGEVPAAIHDVVPVSLSVRASSGPLLAVERPAAAVAR